MAFVIARLTVAIIGASNRRGLAESPKEQEMTLSVQNLHNALSKPLGF